VKLRFALTGVPGAGRSRQQRLPLKHGSNEAFTHAIVTHPENIPRAAYKYTTTLKTLCFLGYYATFAYIHEVQ